MSSINILKSVVYGRLDQIKKYDKFGTIDFFMKSYDNLQKRKKHLKVIYF